ncbi:hypothetical protein EYF80_010597 [Liparis tanakae]|uniref:Uncharacterized protein n=1 Tax=Liparis tanakae TaxID=230148 RepID=A0A4Z2IM94_9TELE|nr:hypothetical protein EYF80_010597 [Liparis tanakae]
MRRGTFVVATRRKVANVRKRNGADIHGTISAAAPSSRAHRGRCNNSQHRRINFSFLNGVLADCDYLNTDNKLNRKRKWEEGRQNDNSSGPTDRPGKLAALQRSLLSTGVCSTAWDLLMPDLEIIEVSTDGSHSSCVTTTN